MATNPAGVFAGFEEIELEDGVTLVYGVNVIRIDAEVQAERSATVGELIEKYRGQLALPKDAVVFVDGVKVAPDARIPADASRVEVIKPAGEKGVETPIIGLDDADAVRVEVFARDQISVLREETEELGRIDRAVAAVASFIEGFGIVRQTAKQAVIGRTVRSVVGTVAVLRQVATIRRRLPVSTSELTVGLVVEEMYLGDQRIDGDFQAYDLEQGQTLRIITPGESREMMLADWEAQLAAKAAGVFAHRPAEQAGMKMAALRAHARALGVKPLPRTRKGLEAACLSADKAAWDEAHRLNPA